MFEKIEIIYDFDGYKDPKIKDVKLTRVNGFKTKITREGEKEMAEHKLINISGADAKRILEVADRENIDIEAIIDFIKKLKGVKKEMTDENNDEKRFTEEEKKVTEYLELHKGENLTYRDAVLAVLDRTEPIVKKEFTEEEKKQKEDLKKVEDWLLLHPRSSYSEAVRVALNKEELTLEEKLVEEYLIKNPKSTYREAVLEALSILKKEEKS